MDPPVIVSMCTVTNEVAAVIFWQIYERTEISEIKFNEILPH